MRWLLNKLKGWVGVRQKEIEPPPEQETNEEEISKDQPVKATFTDTELFELSRLLFKAIDEHEKIIYDADTKPSKRRWSTYQRYLFIEIVNKATLQINAEKQDKHNLDLQISNELGLPYKNQDYE